MKAVRAGCFLLVAAAVVLTPVDAQATINKGGARKGQAKHAGGKKGGKAKEHNGGKPGDGPTCVRPDVMTWILGNNPGLKSDFLQTEPPDRVIALPNGESTPIYKLTQFLDVNFHLTFHARKKDGEAIVKESARRLRLLLATPAFRERVLQHKSEYRISGVGNHVPSGKAYDYLRHIKRDLGVTAGKQFHAPVGGGSGIAAPSWAVWKAMNLFWHEACHCIGIGHNSGGLSGPIAGTLRQMDRQKQWDYNRIDLNQLKVQQ